MSQLGRLVGINSREQPIYEPSKQTVASYSELKPFIETELKKNDIQNDTFRDLEKGYVAVVCIDENILLIKENIILNSQLMSVLAGARPADNLREVIYIANTNATFENMKTVCLWLDQHITFSDLDYPDDIRKQYDLNFLNGKNYLEVMQLMHLSIFLELHPYDWHRTQQTNQLEQLASEGKTKEDYEQEPVFLHEICANVLGDMMASCKTPTELQTMFSKLIGDQALTAQDKYDIVVNDAWIHGDDGVRFLLNKLRQTDGQIPEWNTSNPDRIQLLTELGLDPDAKINPVRLKGENNTGIEVGANWWG